MPLDPISYSLIKNKISSMNSSINSSINSSNNSSNDSNSVNIVYSTTEPSDKDVIWFDLNHDRPRLYNTKSGKWGYLLYLEGYTDFDNNQNGHWTNYISIPITILPSESIQYKIEINGNTIRVYTNDDVTTLTSADIGLYFWNSVQPDGSDIRVFDEVYVQKYFWIETFDYTSRKMVIWVKIDAGQEQVNIAYGNSSCTVSNYYNGDMTFEFFDDFIQNTIGTKWQVQVSSSTIIDTPNSYVYIDTTNGYAVIDSVGDNVLVTKYFTIDRPFVAETKVKCESYGSYGGGLLWFIKTGNINRNCEHAYATSSNLMLRHGTQSSTASYTGTAFSSATNTWYIRQLYLSNTDVISRTFYEDGRLIGGYTLRNNTDNVGARNIGLDQWVYGSSGHKAYFDWIRVRKCLASDLSFDTPIIKEF